MIVCPDCGSRNSDNTVACIYCGFNLREVVDVKQRQRRAEETLKIREQRAIVGVQSDKARKADLTEKVKINDLYEYDVVTIRDSKTGSTDISSLRAELDKHGREGWRLVNTFTNELGVNSSSFAGYGTNATIDEVVLIFERCIKRASYSKNE